MNIKDKLKLSARKGRITLIREGLFLRAYNESAYIVTTCLGYDFQLHIKTIKKLYNQTIVFCGFPQSHINNYFADVHATDYGFEVVIDYSLVHYATWRQQVLAQANLATPILRASSALADYAGNPNAAVRYSPTLQINYKQYQFIQQWQQGRYSLATLELFMSSLQRSSKHS